MSKNRNNVNNNADVGLISTLGLDEMQKEQAYKIAFNCFQAFYWSNVIFSMILVCIAFIIENVILSYIGITLIVLASVIYIVYAVKSANKGIMNPDFIKRAKTKIVSMTLIGFAYSFQVITRFADGEHITYLYAGIFMAILYISHIISFILVKKNNKVMNTETEEEE